MKIMTEGLMYLAVACSAYKSLRLGGLLKTTEVQFVTIYWFLFGAASATGSPNIKSGGKPKMYRQLDES